MKFIFTCDLWFSHEQITVVGSESEPHAGRRRGKASCGAQEEAVSPCALVFKHWELRWAVQV